MKTKLTCPNCREKIEKFKRYFKKQTLSNGYAKKNILNKLDEDLLDTFELEEIKKLKTK